MKKAILSLAALALLPLAGHAASPAIEGEYVGGQCECVEYAEKRACSVTPPQLNTLATSVLQSNPYVYPAETGATVKDPSGKERSVRMWVYKTSIGAPEFKVREGDEVAISLAFKGNSILVTAKNKTLEQPAFTFPLNVPADNATGGAPGQPAQTKTVMDETGFMHTSVEGQRYTNNGTGETGDKFTHAFFMIRKVDEETIEIGRIFDHTAKPDYSWSKPKTFNFESLVCVFKKNN